MCVVYLFTTLTYYNIRYVMMNIITKEEEMRRVKKIPEENKQKKRYKKKKVMKKSDFFGRTLVGGAAHKKITQIPIKSVLMKILFVILRFKVTRRFC